MLFKFSDISAPKHCENAMAGLTLGLENCKNAMAGLTLCLTLSTHCMGCDFCKVLRILNKNKNTGKNVAYMKNQGSLFNSECV